MASNSQPKPEPTKNKTGLFKSVLKELGLEGAADVGLAAAIIVFLVKMSSFGRFFQQGSIQANAPGGIPIKHGGYFTNEDEKRYGILEAKLVKDDSAALPLLKAICQTIPPEINPNDNWWKRVGNAIAQAMNQSRYRAIIGGMETESETVPIRDQVGSPILDQNGRPRTMEVKTDRGLEFLKMLVKMAEGPDGVPAVIQYLQSRNILPSGKVTEEMGSSMQEAAQFTKGLFAISPEQEKKANKVLNRALWALLGGFGILVLSIIIVLVLL